MKTLKAIAATLGVSWMLIGCGGDNPATATSCADSVRTAVAAGDLPQPAAGSFRAGFTLVADSEEPDDHCWAIYPTESDGCQTFMRRSGDSSWHDTGALPADEPCTTGDEFTLTP